MNELPFLEDALRDHDEVIARARALGKANGIARVVVAAAEEDDVLAALYECKKEGIANAILVGNREKVHAALDLAGVPADTFELIETESDEESALKAATIAASGDADVVMKGYLKTSTLLKTLLKSEHGLRDRELVSHSAVLYVPRYGKLLNVTDGGTLVKPTINQKMIAIANGATVMRSVGIDRPKIAILGPADDVSSDRPETEDAHALADLARQTWGEWMDVAGPMTLQTATQEPVEDHISPVAGDADVLLAHTLEEGNIIAKTLIQFGGAIFMGVIAGAKVPISLVSRSDTMLNKMASIALAVCLADYQRRGFEPLPAYTPKEVNA
ncbi:hypothetical protein KQI63_12795 [bacterium]|nr:hypothetical protein [bacterium]